MRPMVAHTPRSSASSWRNAPLVSDAGTMDEELHTPPIGIDPRLEPESTMNEAQAAEVPGTVLGGLARYAGMATAPTMMGGAGAIVTGAARSRLRPIATGAAIGAGQAILTGGDVARGAIEGAVIGAGTGGAAVRLGAGRAAAKVAAETAASEAAPDAATLLKIARSASASSTERHAARLALQKMGWVAPEAAKATETVAEAAAPATESLLKKIGKSAAKKAAPAAKAASGGAIEQNKALMTFAKEIAARNPKVGEKIWMLLDESGNPVKVLTPDQAGAAARKGLKTTWVKNLWAN
jgi:hypothetical protein